MSESPDTGDIEIQQLVDLVGTQAEGLMPEYAIRLVQELKHRTESEQRYAELVRRERSRRIEAEAASAAKDRLLALVAHELRTPLTAILGWAQLAKSGVSGDLEVQQALDRIETNATIQAQLISDLLDGARVGNGKLRMTMLAVDLVAVINAAVDVVRPAANAKGISLTSEMGGAAIVVHGDALRLQQVVWNLLTNAVKFTPSGGSVQVQWERSGHLVHVSVIDTGKGIRAGFLPQVFEQFQQESADGHKGLGLGLSLVRQIVELHGGSVRAESEGPGRGATFTVTLPVMGPSER